MGVTFHSGSAEAVAEAHGSGSGYGSGSGSGSGSGYGDGDGSGYGYGDGDGSGSGYGYGDGSGYGYGYGSGYGYGYGDGDGSGSGYGDGYGSGYGDGDGSGSGYGYGSGSSQKLYLQAVLDASVGGDRAAALRGSGATLAFWRSNKDGRPCNGGSGDPVKPGTVHEETGTAPCHRGMLHATMKPEKWKGERLWAVALWNAVEVDEDKYAATKREILAEIPNFFAV